jgi:hypothetical protein
VFVIDFAPLFRVNARQYYSKLLYYGVAFRMGYSPFLYFPMLLGPNQNLKIDSTVGNAAWGLVLRPLTAGASNELQVLNISNHILSYVQANVAMSLICSTVEFKKSAIKN